MRASRNQVENRKEGADMNEEDYRKQRRDGLLALVERAKGMARFKKLTLDDAAWVDDSWTHDVTPRRLILTSGAHRVEVVVSDAQVCDSAGQIDAGAEAILWTGIEGLIGKLRTSKR